ncbi:DNA processing protein DprA/Smf [Candidatus Fokinia solitaria]|uniref:DNA processing protein DprA/Smf n=1 Tax=Candidatus Fokinia solitaria TaxID=1802984 RepID=A0A2U8BSG6_9RICK|nr:DNA-processing protein DprA [Candidatus Fokinia solitaria]AWD33220.1 DNA processing protein DprA/Smf [Candidatus Fokinia solitaria]
MQHDEYALFSAFDIVKKISAFAKDKEFEIAWLRLARTSHIRSATFFSLLNLFSSPALAIEHIGTLKKQGKLSNDVLVPSVHQIQKEIRECHALGARMIFAYSDEYPDLLLKTYSPPPVLTVKGDVSLLRKHKVAIVGARNASIGGGIFAKRISAEISKSGFVVVSGLADGIDRMAHEGALEGGTIGVVGSGISHIYPKACDYLYRQMYRTGLVVSQYPISSPPLASYFPERNAIIAGLCSCVVVIEASHNSGTLVTARTALEEGREVLAVPGFPMDPRSKGSNKLIRDGAVLVEDAEDVLKELAKLIKIDNMKLRDSKQPSQSIALRLPMHHGRVRHIPKHEEEAIHQSLTDVLSYSSYTTVEEILAHTNFEVDALMLAITELELSGELERNNKNHIRLIYKTKAA